MARDNAGNNNKSSTRGEEYEKFVAEVFNSFQRKYGEYYKRKDFVIKKNFFAKDLPNIENILKGKNEKEKANALNTELADVYFSYTDDDGKKIETYIECKSGKFNKKDAKKFISKMKCFEIKNVNKIFVYNEDENIQKEELQELQNFCHDNGIELRNIRRDSGLVQLMYSYCLQIIFVFNEKTSMKDIFIRPFGKRYVLLCQDWIEDLFKEQCKQIKEKSFLDFANKMPDFLLKDEKFNKKIGKEELEDLKEIRELSDKDRTECFFLGHKVLIRNEAKKILFSTGNKAKNIFFFKYTVVRKNDGNLGLKINNEYFCYLRKPIDE